MEAFIMENGNGKFLFFKASLIFVLSREDNSQGKRVQLYVMDLNSANGTFVNSNKIESQKFVQLLEKASN